MSVRLFIGGLDTKIEDKQVQKKFAQYGEISACSVKEKKDIDGNVIAKFAYLNIAADSNQIHECISHLNGISWKGSELKVEVARESFLEKLKREREGKEKPMLDEPTYQQKPYQFQERNSQIPKRNIPFNYEQPYEKEVSKESFGSKANDDYSSQQNNGWDTGYQKENAYPSNSYGNDEYQSYNDKQSYGNDQPQSYNDEQSYGNDQYQSYDNNQNHDQWNQSKSFARSTPKQTTMKRYDPTANQNDMPVKQNKVEKSLKRKQETSKVKLEVRVDKNMFANTGSFSLLEQFGKPDVDEDDEMECEEAEPVVTEEPQIAAPVFKKSKFFTFDSDDTFEEAVKLMTPELTEDRIEGFNQARIKLLNLCNNHSTNAKFKKEAEVQRSYNNRTSKGGRFKRNSHINKHWE